MTYESVRIAIATYILAQRTLAGITVPFEFENLEAIDHSTRSDAFVTVALEYQDASQADLAAAPQARRDGELAIHIHVPIGSGTKLAGTLLDQMVPFLQFKQISNVQLQAARVFKARPVKGFYVTPLYLSFYYRE